MGLIARTIGGLFGSRSKNDKRDKIPARRGGIGHGHKQSGHGDGANGGADGSLTLADACKMKQWVKVPELLEQEDVDVNAFDTIGKGNALHWAAWYGHVATLRLLIDKGADINKFSKMGALPIHLAVRSGQIAVMHTLWCHDATLICRKDSNGRTPMHHAALEGSPGTIEWLYLHGASLNATDAIGATPLHWASHDGRMLASQLLFNYNVRNNEHDEANYRTPLHLIATKGRWSLLESILNLRPEAYGGPEVFEWTDKEGKRPVDLVKWNFLFKTQIRVFALWLRCRGRRAAHGTCVNWCLSFRPRMFNTSLVVPFYHLVHDVAYLGILLPCLIMYDVLYAYIVVLMVVGAFLQAVSIYYWVVACTSDPGYCKATERLESNCIGPDHYEQLLTDTLTELNDKCLEKYGPPKLKKPKGKNGDDKEEEEPEEPTRAPLDPAKEQELDEAIAEIKGRLVQNLQQAAAERSKPYSDGYQALLCSEEPVAAAKDWGRQACTVCGRIRLQRSKHCKDCGRCVSRFDHHCPWIGNCVGSKNVLVFTQFVGITGFSLIFSEVLALQIETVLEFRLPVICLLLLLMCAIDGVCILFTIVLFGRQTLLASKDITEYEASVLHLDRRRKKSSCSQAARNIYRFYMHHQSFIGSSELNDTTYPENEPPARCTDKAYRRYKGTISHPALEGSTSVDACSISITMRTPSQGEWTVGKGSPTPMKVEHDGKKIHMKGKIMELDGEQDDTGVLKGVVIHNGEGGGEFELIPEAKDEKRDSGETLKEGSLKSKPKVPLFVRIRTRIFSCRRRKDE